MRNPERFHLLRAFLQQSTQQAVPSFVSNHQ